MPKTFLVGMTQPNTTEIYNYLRHTDQEEFGQVLQGAGKDGVPWPMTIASMFAKLCYRSLAPGKNKNVTKTRSIRENLEAVIKSGHGSVLEHITFNFITTGCSRVFTHELVRHRTGTAFSQTSGRYCALDEDSTVVLDDPILDGMARDRLQAAFESLSQEIIQLREDLNVDDMPMGDRKKITSAIRRLAPSGLANEIAWSVNLRQLRHMIELRTSVHAEWEIRKVFNDVADMIDPMYLTGGTKNAAGEWKGLRV